MVFNTGCRVKQKDKISRHSMPDNGLPEFFILGISSTEADYKLSLALNKQSGFDLRHSEKGVEVKTGTEITEFSRFSDPSSSLSLVSNKSEGKFLIRKLKNLDFFLVLDPSADFKKAEALASTIRKSREITAVFVFRSGEIADRNTALLIVHN